LRILTKKPIMATEAEIKENPRSRSAKLRIAEKKFVDD
jgi:16S rRNA (cytosine1402-N4)-methyltransferase